MTDPAPTTDPAPVTDPSPTPADMPPQTDPAPAAQPPESEIDWQAKAAEFEQQAKDNLTQSRKHEGRAKDNKAQLDKVLSALGINTDEKPDPAKLANDLTASRSETKAMHIENAVLKAAFENGANPNALTDSRKFMAEVNKLDPTAATFGDDVAAAVKAAVDTNNALRTTPATPSSGTPVTGGSSSGQLTRDQLKTMTPQQIQKAREDGRLNDLMGIK